MAHEDSPKKRGTKPSMALTTNPSKTPEAEKVTNIPHMRAHGKPSRPTAYVPIRSGWTHSDADLIVPAG